MSVPRPAGTPDRSGSGLPFVPLNQEALRERVVTAIRDAVIQGKLRPGEKVPEDELALRFGVSRTPVREAIRILEQQGMVRVLPKKGTYIATVDPRTKPTAWRYAPRSRSSRSGRRWNGRPKPSGGRCAIGWIGWSTGCATQSTGATWWPPWSWTSSSTPRWSGGRATATCRGRGTWSGCRS